MWRFTLKAGPEGFRPVTSNPGSDVEFQKSASGQSFHGLKKFSLNHAVQDPTFSE
jgi:hypothetical protein